MHTALVTFTLCGVVLIGCTSTRPEAARVENAQTLAATVTAIDHEKRLVSLQSDDGRTATVEVSPEVTNLEQVETGDKVVVRYYEAIAARLRTPEETRPLDEINAESAAVQAEPGARPGAGVGRTVTTTVVIDAVDRSSNTVVFRGPSGMTRSVEVVDPQMRNLVQGLKKGDHVEVTYSEALAVSVEPAT